LRSRGIDERVLIGAAFSLFCRPDGSPIGYAEVGKQAEFHQIQLRTGCFCNPGACQEALALDTDALIEQLRSGHVCLDDVDIINGQQTGAVRASFGYTSHPKDVDTLVDFLAKEFLNVATPVSPLMLHLLPDASPLPVSTDGLHIEALYLYPIKSCAGMKVTSWPLRGKGAPAIVVARKPTICNSLFAWYVTCLVLRCSGLAFDREWAVVDASGRAIRMKNATKMSQIHPVVDLRSGLLVVSVRAGARERESPCSANCGGDFAGHGAGYAAVADPAWA
jgi:molybdenum cofactor sulfurtransferase